MGDSVVGIIANPASGKDIRRLVAHGTVFDNEEKVSIVRRILLSCHAAGVGAILYMPDYYRIVERAHEGIRTRYGFSLPLDPLPMTLTGLPEDTATAARLMAARDPGCIVTLGGDGTNRLVAGECGSIPLLPISTGTNNVFPEMVEATIAGLAAGLVAGGHASSDAVYRAKRLAVIRNGETAAIALVDAIVLEGVFVGAKAMWDTDNLRQAVLTRCHPADIGMAAIGGGLHPVSHREPGGLAIVFAPGRADMIAAIAPGLICPVGIESFAPIPMGTTIPIQRTPCVVALDGEREVTLAAEDKGLIRLEETGPRVVDIGQALAGAQQRGFFTDRNRASRFQPWI